MQITRLSSKGVLRTLSIPISKEQLDKYYLTIEPLNRIAPQLDEHHIEFLRTGNLPIDQLKSKHYGHDTIRNRTQCCNISRRTYRKSILKERERN